MNAAFIIVKDYSCFSFILRPFPHMDLFDPHYRYEVLIHFHERIQIDAFSMKTIGVLVLGGPAERIEMYAFSNENALVWTRALIFHSPV